MTKLERREFRLALVIGLPLIIAAAGMVWAMSQMLDRMAESVNTQERVRTWQAVQSAIHATRGSLTGIIVDNARWDDAVDQAYGPIDADWMFNTWGVGTDDINYDTMFLVDAAGNSLISFRHGERFEEVPANYYGSALRLALGELPKDKSTFDTVSSLVRTADGLAVMAAAPIMPTTQGKEIPTDRPHVLVFSRLLSDELLVKLGKQYIVDELRFVSLDSADRTTYHLFDRWGQPVTAVAWRDRNPGQEVKDTYRYSAFAIVLALVGVMVPLTVVHFLTMRRLDAKERQATLAAVHDALSGLPNRVRLLAELGRKLPKARKSELALAFIDLDGFKAVNDAYDHETGDKLIKAVAAGLSTLIGNDGLIARLGGDEFAVLMTGHGAAQKLETVARNVIAFVREPFDIDGRIAAIGASIGIAELGDETLEPNELMRRADIAMYEAKESGRNQYRRFDASLDQKRSENLEIANELRFLLETGAFEVAYQPMVSSWTRDIVGVEALARWPKASARLVTPDRFIPIAEEHGLIDMLAMHVLKVSCRDMTGWQGLKLAINLSPVQINNRNLVKDIRRVTEETGFDIRRLEVELTESLLIRNPERAKRFIKELKSCGVTVALDDFGTGYASVGYLREYAFDKVKLDRSLTQSMAQDPATQQVVYGTIMIAKGLSAEIIAEGIETEEEARLMRVAGCEQLQGFYFSKPVAVGNIGELLNEDIQSPLQATA